MNAWSIKSKADRVLSTRYFQAHGEALFLRITHNIYPEEDRDVCRRRQAFRQIVKAEFQDLEYDSHSVARWFPLGSLRKTIVLDPIRAFGRPIIESVGVPVDILCQSVKVEGSIEKVADLFDVPVLAINKSMQFQKRLIA